LRSRTGLPSACRHGWWGPARSALPMSNWLVPSCSARPGVALLVSVGVLLLPDSVELEGAEFLLASLISLIGFAVARGAGASLLRAVVYSLAVLVCAVIIAVPKNLLAGH
jgi:hypothetical protein